jgi:hypothetical protein
MNKPYAWIAPSVKHLSPSQAAKQQFEHIKPTLERFKKKNPNKKWQIVSLEDKGCGSRGYIVEDTE